MKIRLDKLLVERGLVETRSKALGLVMSGDVLVNGEMITKAGAAIEDTAEIVLKQNFPYVSRAAKKLEAALDEFAIDCAGKIAIDVGASTGGFTDLMLTRGIRKVYAVDVGRGQLHWRLRNNDRVVNIEGVNARNLDTDLIQDPCDMATFDVSFISLKLVIPPVLKVLRPCADIIALIKPQFEAGRHQVGKGGIVKDQQVVKQVLDDMQAFLSASDLTVSGVIPAPIKGAKGNQEYLVYAMHGEAS
ncbi:MAG: TlyA family RNA methyltransferase [Deltaproteobacteria bacterium]|nr:TlyA family RNA methyltransferase [Deltaproteobacteria bacterium]